MANYEENGNEAKLLQIFNGSIGAPDKSGASLLMS